ncbi:ATP-dependent RNA helicase glh-1 [Bienertia sinuspersici]
METGQRDRVIDQSPWSFDNHLLLLRELSAGPAFDYDESDISGWAKYMRVRVRLRVDKPLPRGTVMKIGGERILVDIKVERLPRFCYACGCLGHVLRECVEYDEDVAESELPYATWLRASSIKTDLRDRARKRLNSRGKIQATREVKMEI